MNIHYALMSCDDNPMYLDFWPLVSKVWKIRFNIDPILIYVSNKKMELDQTYGEVIQLNPIDNFSITPQAQFARLWYLQFLKDKICITSDIDMFPLSKWYFQTQLNKINDDEYVVLAQSDYNNICYNVASGFKFKEILELKDNWSDQINILNEEKYQKDGEIKWASDEIFLNDILKNKNIHRILRAQNTRIDRTNWNYNITKLKLDTFYYDSHSLRPYNTYKNQIDLLINQILE